MKMPIANLATPIPVRNFVDIGHDVLVLGTTASGAAPVGHGDEPRLEQLLRVSAGPVSVAGAAPRPPPRKTLSGRGPSSAHQKLLMVPGVPKVVLPRKPSGCPPRSRLNAAG